MKRAPVLKIVVASPGDVQAERDMIPAIVDELNKGIAEERSVRLEVYRWETDAYPGFHPLGPQGQIDSCLRIEDCGLLIGIFWKRFGTPVLDVQSGTEHEIRLALESCEKMGRPQLMIYFNQAPHEPQSQAEKEQWQQVLDFKQSLSQKVLWWEYNGKDQFRDFVRQHLTKFIRGDYSGLPLDELLQAYRDHLTRRVSTVCIFGEAETRPLEKVFVELTLTEEYERPTINAQWLGLMDAELRRRRDIFARDDEDREIGKPEKERKKEKRTLKPDELLRRRTQAVIVGAPGCGKTTLLRYLAMKTLQADKRFPVFLELKSLSEKVFEAAEGNLVELLFAKAVAAPPDFSVAEIERSKAFFLARLKAGELTIFLDGLDEVAGAKFFNALCRSVNEFMASAYRHNDLIISTRPYSLQQRFEGLQEMEIAALIPRQIEAFLQHYYGDDPTTKPLQQELRRRRELREMARVPFLLSVIAYLYRQQGEIVGERLELYRQLVQQLVTQLDREKNVERFYLLDPDGSLKRDFLKQLAYERLFVDEVEKDAERLILTGEIIATKAVMFCQTHLTTSPHLLAADVKATPLLREIGSDAYAFIHLTLQEYLAALALAEQPDCEKTFCHAYFNSTLAEMEALPMTLGLVRKPDDFYAALEGLPESLSFANMRLRARGLAYGRNIKDEHLTKLADGLREFIIGCDHAQAIYLVVVFRSFAGAKRRFSEFFVNCLSRLFHDENHHTRRLAARFLGEIGKAHAVEILLDALDDKADGVRQMAAWALGKIRDKRAIKKLLIALNDEKVNVHWQAAGALGEIGGDEVVDSLIAKLKAEKNNDCGGEIYELGNIGDERAIEPLLTVLQNPDGEINWNVVNALAKLGEVAVTALIEILNAKNESRRLVAIGALRTIASERALEALFVASKGDDKKGAGYASRALSYALDQRDAVVYSPGPFFESLPDYCIAVKNGEISREQAVKELFSALKRANNFSKQATVNEFTKLVGEEELYILLSNLKDSNWSVCEIAAEALGEIGDETLANGLARALSFNNSFVRQKATQVVGYYATDMQMLATLQHMVANDPAEEMRTAACEAAEKYANKLRYFT